jgi:hypothetical protein
MIEWLWISIYSKLTKSDDVQRYLNEGYEFAKPDDPELNKNKLFKPKNFYGFVSSPLHEGMILMKKSYLD